MFLGIIYLMCEVGSTQNTGLAVERLQKVQRQDWMLEKFPPTQTLEGGQLCIYSCLVMGRGKGWGGGKHWQEMGSLAAVQ